METKRLSTLSTPAIILPTIAGTLPHIPQHSSTIVSSPLHISIQDFIPLLTTKKHTISNDSFPFSSLKHYCAWNPSNIMFSTLRSTDKNTSTNFNRADYSYKTHQGSFKISPIDYAKVLNIFKPDFVISPFNTNSRADFPDSTPKSNTSRNIKWLESLIKTNIDIPIIAALDGEDDIEQRRKTVLYILEKYNDNVAGFALPFYFKKGSCIDPKLLTETCSLLPLDKPRIVYGVETFKDFVTCIRECVDFIDGAWIQNLVQSGLALNLHSMNVKDVYESESENWPAYNVDCGYVDNNDIFVEGCGCFACSEMKYTKSYVYHLFHVEDLLFGTVLMTHNLWQLEHFMQRLRNFKKNL